MYSKGTAECKLLKNNLLKYHLVGTYCKMFFGNSVRDVSFPKVSEKWKEFVQVI